MKQSDGGIWRALFCLPWSADFRTDFRKAHLRRFEHGKRPRVGKFGFQMHKNRIGLPQKRLPVCLSGQKKGHHHLHRQKAAGKLRTPFVHGRMIVHHRFSPSDVFRSYLDWSARQAAFGHALRLSWLRGGQS